MARTLYIRKEFKNELGLAEFPNFHASGSIIGMKRDYYGKNAMLIRCGGYIYNVTDDIYNKAKNIINFK